MSYLRVCLAYTATIVVGLAMVGCGVGRAVVVQATVDEYVTPPEVETVHPVVTQEVLSRM